MTASDSARVGTEEQGLVIERIFDAPRELVWRAWTEPEHFKRWYGPKGMSLHACEIDFRVGGRHLFGMRTPDGHDYFTTGVYREIVPLERFVATDSLADEHGNVVPMGEDVPFETLITVELEDLADGKTKLTLRQVGWPDDSMATHAGVGWNEAFDKLAEALAIAG
jgi:uncharacterized protein YndB with AHSA1/START domain